MLTRIPRFIDSGAIRFTNIPDAVFVDTVAQNGWPVTAYADRLTDQPGDVEGFGFGTILQAYVGRDGHAQKYVVLVEERGVVYVTIEKAGEVWTVHAHAAAGTTTEAQALVEAFMEKFPKREPLPDDRVNVAFWVLGQNGPYYRNRKIVSPSWAEIEGNYALRTRTALAPVMALRPPIEGGQLVLFHGEPGTGKTWAIRSLMRQWKSWCRPSYIIDAEKFFGRAEYMMNVILDAREELEELDEIVDEIGSGIDDHIPSTLKPPRLLKWHVLIAEDADEFVRVDAKTNMGQSLGRLLNVVDGLVGQGLRLLVLLTANEQIGRMHPALTRSGRCLANVEFDDLSAEETAAWVSAQGVAGVMGRQRLSSLYAAKRGTIAAQTLPPGLVPLSLLDPPG